MLNTRDEYIKLIRQELLGPGSEISIPDHEHELISNAPHTRYSIGILFPHNCKMNAENDDVARSEADGDAADSEEAEIEENESAEAKNTKYKDDDYEDLKDNENLDEEISLAAQNMPSSIGMTFFARGNTDTIHCNVQFGTYRHAKAPDCKIPFHPQDPKTYVVPSELDAYIHYDAETSCLYLKGSLTRPEVRKFKERDFLGDDPYGIIDSMYKLCSQLKNGFVREPHTSDIEICFNESDYVDLNDSIDGTSAKVTALRRKINGDLYSITVMLVNDEEGNPNGTNCIFQPKIEIATSNNDFCFCEYSGVADFNILDSEEQSLELQYRNKKVYATGLGTSANWDIDENGIGILYNDFFPEVEVPGMDFALPEDAQVDPKALSMKYLSDFDTTPKDGKIALLKSVVKAYRKWIERQYIKLQDIDQKYNKRYHAIAQSNLAGCEKSLERMESGLSTLESNTLAWNAFNLANRAMYMQRVHLKIQEKTSDKDRFPGDEDLEEILNDIDYRDIDQLIKDRYSWRPFQLAFLLMSVDSVCLDSSTDREIVDLIWFPTGGGKTEAYLGLTAFTIFYRRLAHLPESDGTTVIMRYTLRLLAAQQFTRASTLICACEYIRRDAIARRSRYGKYPLGDTPITIGLWIGGEHTPNKNDKAKEELNYLLKATASNLRDIKDKHNKFQVLKCPWCGTKLVKEREGNKLVGSFGYRMRNNRHFELFCPQESCYFNEIDALPIQIVDDELYANPPTLLFGTVDKFAMLPWKKEIGAFFGIGTTNRAPELIIQDELHLISGPLGTMVGLYETIIDLLCRDKGIPTKIVASTATIRKAKEQCSALYDREVAQFPHPALDAEDSFFARESTINYEKNVYGRKYIGLMPSGKTKAMMEIRAIAALLQTINMMDLPDDIKDKFWTLTVYFNSLKDLGKCTTLVDDDVKDFIKRTAYRLGTARDARMITRADELTSRVSTTELNETLDKLEKLTYSKENRENKRYASNVLLATNMISVGIDVARLNVMLLVGQPKLTSEYIQASSRVGRSFPGVAFAMYDGSKSRDRSHYEQFKAYHESFYKYVEPTGATPFSKPARDRALHAVVFALMRYLEDTLSNENDAASFSRAKYQKQIERIKTAIIKRNDSIIKRLNTGMDSDSASISNEIDTYFELWERLAEDYDEQHFSYGEKYMMNNPEESDGRLLKSFNTAPRDKAFDTMTSMRNVDSTVCGKVLIWE